MRSPRRALYAITALALTAGTIFVSAAPSAADLPTAPGCIHRRVDDSGSRTYVHLSNYCSTGAMYVKVVVSWGPDSNCMGLGYGQTRTWAKGIGSYDRTVLC